MPNTLPKPPATPPANLSVLFICLGNICRSPMAEGVLLSLTSSTSTTSFALDSAGTAGYHVGASPDRRTIDVLRKHGMSSGYSHAAREVAARDFVTFDWIFAMDEENLDDLREMREAVGRALDEAAQQGGGSQKRRGRSGGVVPAGEVEELRKLREERGNRAEDGLSHVALYGAFGGKDAGEEVIDPYYGGKNGFDIAFEQVERFGRGFLSWLGTDAQAKGKGGKQGDSEL